ncbi:MULTISPECIES: DMT family transporter [Paraburkholderia]|uniref:DMT family transporter n=1 Tax=Paraburkholderia dipogonis TaxID=1211383 RepID=A0A4Y8MGI9_9BURK|nr:MULTISPECIES: DMT family transporter [Paraburkholderia]RKR31499.1 putative membrane protein [Paraburkholderia sp. BL17N1]TFE36570.1 DMT family transporter [Paraburkholderia dipogonis]
MLQQLNGLSFLPNKQTLRGIILMSCGTFLFSIVDAIARIVSTHYPPNEITFFRMLFGLVPAAYMLGRHGVGERDVTLHRFFGHFMRAVTALSARVLFFAALPHLPLSTAVALQYIEVIFIGLFAVVFLSERFHLSTAVASIVGFFGVVLISLPLTGIKGSLTAMSLVLLSAMFGAGSIIQVKKLCRTEDPAAIVFYFTIIATILSGMSLFVAWVTPNAKDFGYMALIGLTAGAGQLLLTAALANTAASLLAPLGYFGVVWAIVFEYLIWGDSISTQTAVGFVAITGSALYLCMFAKQADAVE